MEVVIRHAVPEDLEAIHEIMLCNGTIQGTMRLPHQSRQHTEKWLEPDDGVYRFVALLDGKVFGYSELITYPHSPRHRHVGEIDMMLVHDKAHGKGLGSAMMQNLVDLADNWMNLNRLHLTVWTTNLNAIGLYKKFGFVEEGVMPKYAFTNGEYTDGLLLGRVLDR
ncbi:MAG: GNAT family N-acetyltransferase [Sneathiella sp.]